MRFRPTDRQIIIIAIALAAIVRLWYIFWAHLPEDHIFSDMQGYVDRANRFFSERKSPYDFFQPIGYSFLLALTFNFEPQYLVIKILHFLASLGTVVLSWRAAARLIGEKMALWVLAILAIHPPLISLSGFFLAETVYALLLSILFYLFTAWAFPWSLRQAFALGLFFYFAAFFKGNHILFLPIFALWLVWGRQFAKKNLSSLLAFALGIGLLAGAHGVYSYHQTGTALWGPQAGGLNFVEGKCPDKKNSDSGNTSWTSPLFAQTRPITHKHWDHPFWDQSFFFKQGLNCIAKDPAVLIESLSSIGYLFFGNQLWPANVSEFRRLSEWYGVMFGMFLFPAMLLGLVFAFQRSWTKEQLPYLLVWTIMLTVFVFKSEIRFRVPFDGIIITLAVLGWSRLASLTRVTIDKNP